MRVDRLNADVRFSVTVRAGCSRKCLDSYPDINCTQCVSTSTTFESSTLDTYIDGVLGDLKSAQGNSDFFFLEKAITYQNTLVETFPLPRPELNSVETTLRVAIDTVNPLSVVQITEGLIQQQSNVDTVTFDFNPKDKSWTRIVDENGRSVFRLDTAPNITNTRT